MVRWVWRVGLVLILAGGIGLGNNVSAQDDPQATIEALEAEIAAAETQIAGIEEEMAANGTPIATPAAGTPTLFGELPAFAPGTPGEVSIVAQSDDAYGAVGLVLQNNTSETVTIVDIYGTARDASGTLIAQANYATIAPAVIAPGAYAIASLSFLFEELPEGTQYAFDIEIGEPVPPRLDLPISEVALTETGAIGSLSNPSASNVGPAPVVGLCFDGTGAIVGFFTGFPSNDRLAPGKGSSFEGPFHKVGASYLAGGPPAETCASWVFGAIGYDFGS